MNTHKNARLALQGRVQLVRAVLDEGESGAAVAAAFRLSPRTVWKWVGRFRTGGKAALGDQSSRPHRSPRAHSRWIRRQVIRARQQRQSALEIAQALGLPLSTVVQLQRRLGWARLPPRRPPEPIRRYEKRVPGALLHVDVKKLAHFDAVGHRIHGDRTRRGRALGWGFVHIAIDDATRLAYAEVLPDERAATVAGFLRRAVAWYRRRRIRVRSVMTDNAKAYTSHLVQAFWRAGRLRHLRTRPYRPQTNGKAERFIRTLLNEWAYRRPYSSSAVRDAALGPYLQYYNTARRHGGLGMRTPAQRLAELR